MVWTGTGLEMVEILDPNWGPGDSVNGWTGAGVVWAGTGLEMVKILDPNWGPGDSVHGWTGAGLV